MVVIGWWLLQINPAQLFLGTLSFCKRYDNNILVFVQFTVPTAVSLAKM